VTDGTDPPSDRRCPLSLALCAGAYWRGRALRGLGRAAFGPEAPGSIRRRRRPGFHQPPGLSAGAATGTRPVHSRVFGWGGESRRAGPPRSNALSMVRDSVSANW